MSVLQKKCKKKCKKCYFTQKPPENCPKIAPGDLHFTVFISSYGVPRVLNVPTQNNNPEPLKLTLGLGENLKQTQLEIGWKRTHR
jgi:hypothetical protein